MVHVATCILDSHAARLGVELLTRSGDRVAKDGTRFIIGDATLWTVDGYPTGPGQAVVFRDWEYLPAVRANG